MANAYNSINPYILDTVTDSMSPAGEYHEVYAIIWASGSLADAISVQDAAGNVKWSATGTIANNCYQTAFDPPLVMNGIKIPTLGSGKVYIYARRTR